MKTKFISFGLLVLSFSLFADDGKTIKLEETRIQLARIQSFEVQSSETTGTVLLKFGVTYSNSCIAGGRTIVPLTMQAALPGGMGSLEYLLRVILQDKVTQHVFCPRNYQPVLVDYLVTIRGLKSGSDYLVQVEGVQDNGIVHVT
jgi:hypothetical protein